MWEKLSLIFFGLPVNDWVETPQLQIATPRDVSRLRWQNLHRLHSWPRLENDLNQPQIPKKHLLLKPVPGDRHFLEIEAKQMERELLILAKCLIVHKNMLTRLKSWFSTLSLFLK